MTTFKVPCPSCEAKVLIKNLNLIGTKVECPKCKYRFKVEAPTEEAPAAESKPAKAEAGGDAGKVAKSKKKLIGIGLGVLAVGLLAVGGYVIFGGDKKKTTNTANNNRCNNITSPGNTEDPDKKEDNKQLDPTKKVSSIPSSDKDSTNLLPNQSVAVYRFNFDKLRFSPLGQTLFDKGMADLFESSMGIKPTNLEAYFHCVVGEKARVPVGLIRLKEPMLEKEIAIVGAGKAKSVNTYSLVPVAANPFFTAIGQSMSGRSLFADFYEKLPEAAAKKDAPLGVCIYDTQHIFVGNYAELEKFLAGLKDGYPEFQTILKLDSPAPDPKTPAPSGPMAPGTSTGPGAPMAPPVPGTTPPPLKAKPATAKDYTSVPSYLSVSIDLKQMLNALEDDPTLPSIVMAEKFDNEVYSRKNVKKVYDPVVKSIDPVLDRTAYLGMNVTNFSTDNCSLTVRIVGTSAEEAKKIAIEHLSPTLTDAVPLLSLMLDLPIVFRNFADPNAVPPPGSEVPGGPGFPSPGGPGGPVPGGPGPGGIKPGGSAGGPPPGFVGAGPMGLSGPPGIASGPPPGIPGGAGLSGPSGPPPGIPGGPGLSGPGGPPPGTTPDPMLPTGAPSQIDLRLVDRVVSISVSINWTPEAYNGFLYPRLSGIANQLKGKTAVFAGRSSWNGLSVAVVKYVEHNKKFPAATIARPPSDSSRLGLSYPPMQRLSFFVELLPYLGRGNVVNTITPGASWYDKVNTDAAGAWVPEFLVPYYEPSSWRATSPLAPEHVLGGTNYVAVAGVGADAARFNPKNPAHEKLVGISGYDWGSTVAEVGDGLANTIYLMQVPPGLARPWAAGGGATVLGLNPENPMADFKHQRPDGKWGTHAIMGDGAVRWIPADIKPSDLLALATRAGGEKLSGDLDAIAPRADGKTSELKADPKPVEAKATELKPMEKASDPKVPAKAADPAPSPREK